MRLPPIRKAVACGRAIAFCAALTIEGVDPSGLGLMNVMRRLRVAVPQVLMRGRRDGTDPHPNPLPQGEGIVRALRREKVQQNRPRANARSAANRTTFSSPHPDRPPQGGRGFLAPSAASAVRGACTSDMPTQSVGTRHRLTYDNRETT